MEHSNLAPKKIKTGMDAGYVYAPWTIQIEPPTFDGYGGFGGKKWAYDIITIKEFIRRRKLFSKFGEKTINKDYYEIVNVSMDQKDNEVVMNVDLVPKVQKIELEFKILPTGGISQIND